MTASLTYVEIDIDRCSLTYGSAPCTASIPATGSQKCFNSKSTCQDREHFSDGGVTLRFGKDASFLPSEIECIPCLIDVDYSPGTISPGVDLGQRASIKATLRDHRSSDTGPNGDKYLADRTYDPFNLGTFFGKFRARHPYLRGRAIRLIRGYVGQDLADMEVRHFVIDSFDGPTPDGKFNIVAKDPLKLADAERAQAPLPSNGYLSAPIDEDDTAFTLLPAGVGSEYPASGTGQIGGKEIVTFTRSGDSITITARAQYGTEAQSHEAQERFQICLEYSGEDPAAIIADLLENYAGFESSWLPVADWLVETGAYLNRLYSRLIAEPTSVKKLVDELIEQAALAVWWDEKSQVVRLLVLRAISTSAALYDESNIIKDSIQCKEQPDRQVSEVWTYFAQTNPLKRDDPDNYRSLAVTKDDETIENYGSTSIKKIFSRWIPNGGRSTAERLNAIQIARFKVPPRRLNLDCFRDGTNDPSAGQGANIAAWFIQDETGAASEIPVQFTRVGPDEDRFKIEAEEMRFDLEEEEGGGERVVIIDVSQNDIDFREIYDDLFPTPASGDEVRCIINSGVIVGSSTTSIKGFDVGSWPTQTGTGNISSGSPIITSLSFNTSGLVAGMQVVGTGIPSGARILSVDSSSQVTLDANCTATTTGVSVVVGLILLTLEVNGLGTAKGGTGGNGQIFPAAAIAGTAGGTAIYTRVPIRLEGTGAVRAPGGGGGGGGGITPFGGDGGGGGGGRGKADAPGGVAPNGPGLPGGTGTTAGAGAGGLNAAPGSGGTQSGGNGGDWATAGQAGVAGAGGAGAAGGAAGIAIDGNTYVDDAGTVTVQGSRVN